MKIHEYQGKQIFAKYGIPVPGRATRPSAPKRRKARPALIDETGMPVVVVKAQIHAGGRGKGGGVKVVKDGPKKARETADALLGMQLVTHQTGPAGQKVRRLYIEQGLDIARELYLGMVVDREKKRIAIMASTEGGVEIEKVAAETPEKILTEHIDPALGLGGWQARKLAYGLGIGTGSPKPRRLLAARGQPAGRHRGGRRRRPRREDQLRRQRRVSSQGVERPRDVDEEDPVELEAKRPGCRTCPRRQHRLPGQRRGPRDGHDGHHQAHCGGEPANFLDVGGGATEGAGHEGLQDDPHSDPEVKGIFVNIFGGIMKCDVIAEGVVNGGARSSGSRCPWWCAWRAPTSTWARSSSRERAAIVAGRHHGDGAQKIVRLVAAAPERDSNHGDLVNKNTRLVMQGITGKSGARSTPSRCSPTARRSWPA
jgi:succinyl-CoA synthetase beta subunit